MTPTAAPTTSYRLTRVRVITGYAPLARFLATLDGAEIGPDYVGTILGVIPRQPQIRSPYAYSPDHTVYGLHGQPVIQIETAHRRYEIFRVEGPILPVESES
jgi:hypothetical protein